MKRIFRYVLVVVIAVLITDTAMAQTQQWRDVHLVKRKETVFGIARQYGITIQQLIDANPEMNKPDYELKKGQYVNIPYPKGQEPKGVAIAEEKKAEKKNVQEVDMRQRAIRVGVMLPLHDINGDGRRMVEYYRGVLMACDSLRHNGISVDIRAWNVPEDGDIQQTLKDEHAAKCDLIIGPLYSKQVKALSEFATAHDIRILIPFSINTSELFSNRNIFQVYQNGNDINESSIRHFVERFSDCHPVFIDCNDSTSKKGSFTFALRRQLEAKGISYSVTNLKSSEAMFQKAFSRTAKNVVILNSGRLSDLNVAFAKINGMTMTYSQINITMFGYPEWLSYTRNNLDNFYKYEVHIPSVYYMNPLSHRSDRFKQKYRWNFHQDMMPAPARFAVTGFDQAYYFIKGLHLYGKQFVGASGMVGYTPIQTPLHFERIGNGGLQNRSLLFVHYTKEHRIETINF